MMTVLEGQSLLDIAIQEAGSPEAAYELAVMSGLSVTDELLAGQQLETLGVINRDIAVYYADKKIRPATTGKVDIIGALHVFFHEAPPEFS